MCGIFGYAGGKRSAARLVLSGLRELGYRGYDSWGVAVVDDSALDTAPSGASKLVVKKRVGKIGQATVSNLPDSTVGLGHTRWATHGGVTVENAHPHVSEDRSIAIVHNGIIENYALLRKKLKRKNHTFVSSTDSEVAVHLVEHYARRHLFPEAVRMAFRDMTGLNAIIAVNSDDKTLVGIRNGSPLVVGFGEGEHYFASDSSALLPYTRSVYFMDEYEMAVVSKAGVTLIDARTGEEKKVKKTILTEQATKITKNG